MNKTEYVKVDYYEAMKETHWDPIFRGLTQRLSNRLTEICYSRTNLPNDLWLFAKLEKIQLKNDINRETNCNLSINNNGTYSQIHLFLKRLGTNITAELESTHSTQVRVQNNGPLLNAKPKASYVSKAYMHIKQATQQTSNCLSTSQNSLLLSPSVSQLIPVQPSHYFRSNPFAQSLQNMPSISISHSPLKLDIIQLNDILLLLSNHMKLAPTILNPLAYTNTQVNNDLLTLSNILILNNLCTISNSALSTHPFIIATRTERQNHRNSYVLLPCLDYQHPFIETPNIMMCKNLLHANYLPQQNSKKLLVTPFNIFSYILNDQSNVFENILPTTSNNFWNNSHLESDFPINSMSVNFIPNNTSKITNLSKIISNHNCIIYSTPFPQLATVNVMSPNLTTVEQLNLSLKSQPIPDIGQYHLDILFVQDEAKTRFMCTKCTREWTSMKGSISFLVILSTYAIGPINFDCWIVNPGANVFFEIFPQVCSSCQNICEPKWYPEEIDKVIRNLFVEIHHNFYQSAIKWDDHWDSRRRDGKPAGPHNSQKCIACQNGLCHGTSTSVVFQQNASENNNTKDKASMTSNNSPSAASSPLYQPNSKENCIVDSFCRSPSCKRRAVE